MARTRTRSIDQSDDNTEQRAEVMSDSRRRRRRDTAEEAVELSVARKDRPTPSTRQVKPRTATNTGIISRIPVVRGIVGYLRGVASELKKVSWPDREETTRLTTVVLGVTAAFAIVLGILDAFLAWWFSQAFSVDSETIFLAVAAGVAVVVGATYAVVRNRV